MAASMCATTCPKTNCDYLSGKELTTRYGLTCGSYGSKTTPCRCVDKDPPYRIWVNWPQVMERQGMHKGAEIQQKLVTSWGTLAPVSPLPVGDGAQRGFAVGEV